MKEESTVNCKGVGGNAVGCKGDMGAAVSSLEKQVRTGGYKNNYVGADNEPPIIKYSK